MKHPTIIAFLCLLVLNSHALAQVRADVLADARVDQKSIPLSGHLTLTFKVEGPKGLEVDRIKTPVSSPVWEVKVLKGPEAAPLPDGRVRWQQSFRLEPLQPGQVNLPLAPIRYRVDRGPWQEHLWKDLAVEVKTEVINPAVDGLRGNSRIEEPPPAPEWPWWAIGTAGLLMACSLLGLVAWRRGRRGDRPTIALPPDQWAMQELNSIDSQSLPQAGQVERYHRLLSDVLRRFVELRLALPATQQTTAEFLNAARQSPHLSPQAQELLRDFLERCDLAKFARAEFGVEECQHTARLARDFVAQTQRPAAKS